MSRASTSTYPENLASGGQLPAELRGRVSLFFVCMFVRHAKMLGIGSLDGAYMHCTWGGTGISPQDSFSYRSNFRFRPRFRSRSSSTSSGDIFYCSGSRQLNHSSFLFFFCFFSVRHKNTRQPFSGTAERIFMKQHS